MILAEGNTIAGVDQAPAHLNAEAKAIKVKDSPRAVDLHHNLDLLLTERARLSVDSASQ